MTIIITNAMKNRLLRILLVGILSGLSAASAFTQVKIGELAPDFSYVDTNGETHSLSDYRGKVVFLALIGYGCPFCRAEAPSTETDIWQYYQSESFQSIALETWNGSLSQAITYVNITEEGEPEISVTIIEPSDKVIRHEICNVKQAEKGRVHSCSQPVRKYFDEVECYSKQYFPLYGDEIEIIKKQIQ